MTRIAQVDRTQVIWHVLPLSLPRPHRHCSTCGVTLPFDCSGKVRLNANGRRLDAWLIYKCSTCERTWNYPLLDRVAVADLPPADLSALQTSDPGWVRARAFDLAALRRHALRVALPENLAVTKRVAGAETGVRSGVAIRIEAPWPTGLRLDRFLAQELGLSRFVLRGLQARGGLSVEQGLRARGARHALRTPVAGSMVLHFDLEHVAEPARPGLIRAFGLTPPGEV